MHPVTLQPKERHFTAFEALGQLYHYKRLSFGVTNGASPFQSVIDKFIKRHNLKKVYAYLDDLTIAVCTLEEHDLNLKTLPKTAKQDGFYFQREKVEVTSKGNSSSGIGIYLQQRQTRSKSLKATLGNGSTDDTERAEKDLRYVCLL